MNENMLQLFPKNWTFCLLILCVMNLSAQDHSPTLFLIGDSTMADKKILIKTLSTAGGKCFRN